jgi:hypothetical protein
MTKSYHEFARFSTNSTDPVNEINLSRLPRETDLVHFTGVGDAYGVKCDPPCGVWKDPPYSIYESKRKSSSQADRSQTGVGLPDLPGRAEARLSSCSVAVNSSFHHQLRYQIP